jgi:hypothetical protein
MSHFFEDSRNSFEFFGKFDCFGTERERGSVSHRTQIFANRIIKRVASDPKVPKAKDRGRKVGHLKYLSGVRHRFYPNLSSACLHEAETA